ncbi:MAG: LysO family transporter [Candidatus Bathyarchaeia archaeon]
MLNIIVPLIAGITIGYLLRNKKRIDLGKVSFGAIIVLIFSMGFSIGSNNELLQSMPKIVLNALVMVGLAMFFSVVFLKVFQKMVKLK